MPTLADSLRTKRNKKNLSKNVYVDS